LFRKKMIPAELVVIRVNEGDVGNDVVGKAKVGKRRHSRCACGGDHESEEARDGRGRST